MRTLPLLIAVLLAFVGGTVLGADPDKREGVVAPLASGQLNPAQQLAHTILESVDSNKQRLEGLDLTVTKDFRDRSVTEKKAIETRLPDGGKMIEHRAPESQTIERVVVLGNRLRVDDANKPTEPSVTYWFDGERWTSADSRRRQAAKMWPHQMSSRVLDPREVAGVDSRSSLAAILSDGALTNATVANSGTITTITTANVGGQKMIVDFDARFGLLPVRSQLFHLNGALVWNAAISYLHVASRNAWIIDQKVAHVYADSADGLADPDSWKQEIRMSVTHRVIARDEAESQLTAVVPAGFQVVDRTDPMLSPEKPKNPAVVKNDNRGSMWLLMGNLVLIPSAAAYYYWRRRKAPLTRI